MIELLMVIMIIAILGAAALPQFLDFRREAKIAAVQQALQAMRTGIKFQIQQAILKCNAAPGFIPDYTSIVNNDITASVACSASVYSSTIIAAERNYVSGSVTVGCCPTPAISNPFKDPDTSFPTAVAACTGYTSDPCNPTALLLPGQTYGGGLMRPNGWCYDESTGHFWAQSDVASECAL